MGKTIKEIAEEIGVSKQAIMKKRKQEPLASQLAPFTSTISGAIVIEEQGVELIKSAFSQVERGEVVADNRQPNPEWLSPTDNQKEGGCRQPNRQPTTTSDKQENKPETIDIQGVTGDNVENEAFDSTANRQPNPEWLAPTANQIDNHRQPNPEWLSPTDNQIDNHRQPDSGELSPTISQLVAMLQEELTAKNKELEIKNQELMNKDSQLEAQQQTITDLTSALQNTTNSLHAAHALHAGTMQNQIEAKAEEEVDTHDSTQASPQTLKGFWGRWFKK